MATPNVGILTNAGKNLIDQVNAGKTKITFSKIVFSSMNNNQLTDDQIKALTTVAPQEVVVNNPEVTLDNNTGETRIRATGNNEALTDGVYVKTYAVYAKDDSGNEILYGITVSPNPNYLPEYDGVTPQAVTYSYKVNISNTSNITFTNSNDIYVSDTDLAEAIQPYAKTVDVNQQLDKKVNIADMRKPASDVAGIEEVNTKVTDNKDGTEQLNGVKVQPYNKLSDITNLRNIVLQTDNVLSYTAQGGVGETIQDFPLYSGFSSLPSGTQIYYSYDLVVKNADGGVHWLGWALNWNAFVNNQHITTDGIHHFQGTATIPDANITSGQTIHSTIDNSHATYQITNLMVVVGSIPVTHLPAPEDKVTDNKDGTIEVNGSSITPADDSKVFHSTVTTLNSTDMNTVLTAGFYRLASGTNGMPGTDEWTLYQVIPLGDSNGVQVAYGTNNAILGMRSWNYNGGTFNLTSWVQFADDSKVAHLSGANNFDTVPTVDNNPLLLASSLPSDLARTGQDTNFTGKLQRNGKDVATTDDLTIVYAGVPSLSFDNNGNYTITASKNADIAHITNYTLYYQVKGNGDFTKTALTPDKLTGTIDLSTVTTATNYEAYATATNVFGESDPSSMVQWSYDPAKASSTPPSLTIADDGTYTITAPTTTPTPIVKYFLYYNVDGQSDSTKLDVGTNLTGSLKELITKPDKTTTYDVQATAMNANAESGVSNSVQFTYVPIDDSIYGASWDRKSSPTLTRTDAAVGLKAGINGAQNDFDNVGPWKGMHRVTDSMNNVFVRVPKFYIRKTQTGDPDNGTATWQVSLVSHGDDWYLPKGFWDFENSKELDYIDIGAYDATGSSSKLTSVAGQAPLVNLSIVDFRKASQANGTGYQIWDIHANDMLQVLFIVEFATLNSQSIMEGIDGGSGAAKSGAADSHKGSSGTAGSGSSAMSYRGIENLYGNVWQFCDGVNFKNNQPWVCEDATNYQSDLFAAPYVRTSYTATSDNANNYIKAMGFDSVHPYAQFTTDDSGSESTYYADYDYPGSGNTILETGGCWGSGAVVGLFRSSRDSSSTGAGAYGGCRLLKKALP